MEKDVSETLVDILKKVHETKQNRPDQYVVAYKLKANDEIHGYHLDSFCQTTKEILRAKRYSGTQPDSQLAIIWKNLLHTLAQTEEAGNKEGLGGAFGQISYKIKQNCFPNLTPDDLYIDAVYLTDGMPEQQMKVVVVKGGSDSTIIE